MLLHQRNRGPAFGLVDMSREMDRLMNSVWGSNGESEAAHWGMPAEIVETADEIRIDIEAPGLRLEDIEVTLENNMLTIAGEKKLERDEQVRESDYRLFERRYGRFQRSFTMPPTVRGDNCQARYDNGVLTLRLPKAEEAKPRRIRIQGGADARNLESGASSQP
jgi:HSP20 family protein